MKAFTQKLQELLPVVRQGSSQSYCVFKTDSCILLLSDSWHSCVNVAYPVTYHRWHAKCRSERKGSSALRHKVSVNTEHWITAGVSIWGSAGDSAIRNNLVPESVLRCMAFICYEKHSIITYMVTMWPQKCVDLSSSYSFVTNQISLTWQWKHTLLRHVPFAVNVGMKEISPMILQKI